LLLPLRQVLSWGRARLLKQKSSITAIVCRPSTTNFRFPFLFAADKRKFAVSIFRLQQINENFQTTAANNRKLRFPNI
jgi:hypothetical protein